jgi:hypothetical protein
LLLGLSLWVKGGFDDVPSKRNLRNICEDLVVQATATLRPKADNLSSLLANGSDYFVTCISVTARPSHIHQDGD